MPVEQEVQNTIRETIKRRSDVGRYVGRQAPSISYELVSKAIAVMLIMAWIAIGAHIFSRIGIPLSVTLPHWLVYPSASLGAGIVLCVLSVFSDKAALVFGCAASFAICLVAALHG